MRTTRPEVWPLYIAEVHSAAPTATGVHAVGKPLPNDWGDAGVLVDPASFKDQIFAAAIGLNSSAVSRPIEGPHSPVVDHDGLHLSAASWIGRRAAKRRKDGKKRAETLKTVDADW